MSRKMLERILPESVRIGPIDYNLALVERLVDGTAKLDGQIRHSTGAISIDDRVCPQYCFQTLWHEVVHGMLTGAGRHEDSQDEGLINCMASGIMQVLRDNPKLRKPPAT